MVWIILLFVFCCLGPIRVGFFSGANMTQPKSKSGEEIIYKRPMRVRIPFLVFACLLLVFTGTYTFLGVGNLHKTTSALVEAGTTAMNVTSDASVSLEAVTAFTTKARNEMNGVLVGLYQVCTGNREVATAAEQMAAFMDGGNGKDGGEGGGTNFIESFNGKDDTLQILTTKVVSLNEQVSEVTMAIQQLDNSLSAQAYYCIPIIILTVLLMVSVLLVWCTESSNKFVAGAGGCWACFTRWVLMPLFILMMLMFWISGCIIFVTAIMNADICYGVAPPEGGAAAAQSAEGATDAAGINPGNTLMQMFSEAQAAEAGAEASTAAQDEIGKLVKYYAGCDVIFPSKDMYLNLLKLMYQDVVPNAQNLFNAIDDIQAEMGNGNFNGFTGNGGGDSNGDGGGSGVIDNGGNNVTDVVPVTETENTGTIPTPSTETENTGTIPTPATETESVGTIPTPATETESVGTVPTPATENAASSLPPAFPNQNRRARARLHEEGVDGGIGHHQRYLQLEAPGGFELSQGETGSGEADTNTLNETGTNLISNINDTLTNILNQTDAAGILDFMGNAMNGTDLNLNEFIPNKQDGGSGFEFGSNFNGTVDGGLGSQIGPEGQRPQQGQQCTAQDMETLQDIKAWVGNLEQSPAALRDLVKSLSCERVSPAYSKSVNEALCTYNVTALTWLMMSLLSMSICGFVMITLRSAVKPVMDRAITSREDSELILDEDDENLETNPAVLYDDNDGYEEDAGYQKAMGQVGSKDDDIDNDFDDQREIETGVHQKLHAAQSD